MTLFYFYIFVIISPLKRTWPFIWRNLNSLHPRIVCTKFDWIWPVGSGEDFKQIFTVFLLFCNYLPLRKGYPLPLNKLESPSPKDDLCQVWLKLVQRFWRRSRKCKSLQTDRQTDDKTDRQTPDNGRSEKLTGAFSSCELKNFSVFLLFCDYLPLEKGNDLHFNNLESPPPKDDCSKFG
jgi:hypothetical protein